MIWRTLALAVCGCLLVTACVVDQRRTNERPAAAGQTESKTGPTHLLTVDAHFYCDGPQQGRPPDGKFIFGTKVWLLRASGSYALVRAENGQEGYVSVDALQRVDADVERAD